MPCARRRLKDRTPASPLSQSAGVAQGWTPAPPAVSQDAPRWKWGHPRGGVVAADFPCFASKECCSRNKGTEVLIPWRDLITCSIPLWILGMTIFFNDKI
jgi:hypothetical protein